MHPTMRQFLEHMRQSARFGSLPSYELGLRLLDGWLGAQHLDPQNLTTEELQRYQRWLAEGYRQASGQPLKTSTQGTRLIPVLAYYRWLEQTGRAISNPAEALRLPPTRKRQSPKGYLELQEATALVQTQAAYVASFEEGSFKRAEEERNLAMLCLALATGRRRQSLLDLRLDQLDLERLELRIEWEKGRAGRVLPVAGWAVEVCAIYLNQGARQRLLDGRCDEGYLFVGSMKNKMAAPTFYGLIRRMHKRAARENPDLEGFAQKRLTPHGLRVSFATLLFKGGCNIRSINELMLHRSLTTTARYTPIPLEDLKRICRSAHPRA